MSVIWVSPPSQPFLGSVDLPYSKSLSNRQLVLGAQTGEPFRIEGLSGAEDTHWLVQALRQVGYIVGREGEVWHCWPPKVYAKRVELFLGEGGTTLRFLLPWLARLPVESVVQVAPPLQRRPLLPLIEALRSAGARLQAGPMLFPLRIQGSPDWRPSHLKVDSSVSSQFLSALFLLAPHLPEGAVIEELSESPATIAYSETTRALLREYGWIWVPTAKGWRLQKNYPPLGLFPSKGNGTGAQPVFFLVGQLCCLRGYDFPSNPQICSLSIVSFRLSLGPIAWSKKSIPSCLSTLGEG